MNRTQIEKIVQSEINKLEKNKSLEEEKNKKQDYTHLQTSKCVWILFVAILLYNFNIYIGFVSILFAGLQNTKEQIKYSQKYDGFKLINRTQYLVVIISIILVIIGVTFGKHLIPYSTKQIINVVNICIQWLYSIFRFSAYFMMVLFLVGTAEYIFTPIYVLIYYAFEWQLTEKEKENAKE